MRTKDNQIITKLKFCIHEQVNLTLHVAESRELNNVTCMQQVIEIVAFEVTFENDSYFKKIATVIN